MSFCRYMGYMGPNTYITDEEEDAYQKAQNEFEKIYRWELFNILQIPNKGYNRVDTIKACTTN